MRKPVATDYAQESFFRFIGLTINLTSSTLSPIQSPVRISCARCDTFGFSNVAMESIEQIIAYWHTARISQYLTVTTTAIEHLLKRANVVITRFGSPIRIGIENTAALHIDMKATCAAFRFSHDEDGGLDELDLPSSKRKIRTYVDENQATAAFLASWTLQPCCLSEALLCL